jgi:RNA polymerase sigma-70 factor (ECF subfamily)
MPDWIEQRMPDSFRDLDPQAIGPIYDQYSSDVYRYVRYRLGDEGVAEDIAGDVFLNLLEALRRGRGPQTNVRAWLLSTASHLVADHLRRAYRRPVESITDQVLDPGPTPGDEFDNRERSRLFQQAYARLTDEQQHVLALRFGEGCSLEETAAVMKKKVNAVKALQFRALAALQRNVQELPHE